MIKITDIEIEKAIGGSYELSDGRKFWIDRLAALEIVRRVRAALEAAEKARPDAATPAAG